MKLLFIKDKIMKKILLIITGLFMVSALCVFYSCVDKGTIITHDPDGEFIPYINGKDTVDFFKFSPNGGELVWVGINRNNKDINLTYSVGKNTESIIILNGNKNSSKVIKGDIISENDSVVVIKKRK